MTGQTHVAIAAAATVAYSAATGDSPDLAGWVAVVIGSLAPDIDSGGGTICRPGSLFGRILPRFLRRLLDFIGLAIGHIVRKIFGHRNTVHWPFWGILCILLGVNLGYSWLAWFGWGFVWHILGDFLTVSGVPIFGPFITRDIKWSPIRTGTWAEYLVALACWVFIGWYGWRYLPSEAQQWIFRFKSLVGI